LESLRQYFAGVMPGVNCQPILEAFSPIKVIKKGEYLIQPGWRAHFMAFIQEGTFRVFYLNDKEEEVTTWFSFQGMFVTDLLCFYKDVPAVFYVEAIEDSKVICLQKATLERLYIAQPEYREFGRNFAEGGMVMVMERMVSLQTKSAEERYRELLDRPIFLQKIPLKYLASYLGITDTSLSRIRKNIS